MILLWVSAGIFDVTGTFPLRKSKKVFQKSYVFEIWLTIHYSLDSGCWLFQPSGSWASNKASTPALHLLPGLWPSQVGSLAFSEVRFGKFYFIILQPFSFERSLNISLDGELPIFFLSSWLNHCPLPHWQAASWDSLQAVHLQIIFLWPLSAPSSEEPYKSWIWPLPTAWRVWQWNLCQASN